MTSGFNQQNVLTDRWKPDQKTDLESM